MSDERRRRRPNPEAGPRRTKSSSAGGIMPWAITIAAALAVIAGGWFLGQALAHAFGGGSTTQTAQTQPSGIPPVTPLPSPSATELNETPAPSPSSSPSAPPTASPSARPTRTLPPTPEPSAAPTVTPAATLKPKPSPVATPTPAPAPTRVPTPAPATVAAPVSAASSAAKQTVLGYIAALKRGDPQTAASYLGNGAPDESFINSQTRILNVTETPNADGSSMVEVQMQTGDGEVSESFQVASSAGGSRILDKTATKKP